MEPRTSNRPGELDAMPSTTFWARTCWGIAAIAAAAFEALAADSSAPSIGLLYNTTENHSLTYDCKRTGQVLMCDFIQTAVRKQGKPEDLPEILAKARQAFKAGEAKIPASECNVAREIVAVLQGKKSAPAANWEQTITKTQRADGETAGRLMIAFCEKPTEENALNLARFEHERDCRTCSVSALTFKQSFRQVRDDMTGKAIWVTVQERPDGPCGIVQLSRFVSETPTPDIPSFVVWKYTARKAITNPDGTLQLGISCRDLDQGEYLYDWKDKDRQLGCDYIKFSPL